MSSTNRSNSRDTHVSDYYITPIQDIQDFLLHFLSNHPDIKDSITIFDPCAGGNPITHLPDGTIPLPANPMSYPEALASYGFITSTNDIRPDSPAFSHGDFLDPDTHHPTDWDMIITNPPFNLALPIIEKALTHVKPGGYVIMLLRLNFFGSKARRPFFQSNMPIETYVHHKRISFAKGATDSIEYMHCVWKK